MTMNVLLIGGGGREHAMCLTLSKSERIQTIFVAPGNGGTSKVQKCINAKEMKASNFEGIEKFCQCMKVEMVFVGPEDPLCAGLANHLTSAGIPCFGPNREAAEIEGSKRWSKEFMRRHGIPTADFRAFTSAAEAKAFIQTQCSWERIVVKASGLAAGKGVIVTDTKEEAEKAVDAVMGERQFGEAGATVVLEERLEGPEVSCLAFTDGKALAFLPPSQDHKRLLDGDLGENTGGMGAYAPCDLLFGEELRVVQEEVLTRAVRGLHAEDRPFVGVLYAGLMLTRTGPKVLEFNCRFGDPETQVLLPLLETDLLDVAEACVEGRLDKLEVRFRSDIYCLCVVGVSRGYPGRYPKNEPITGLDVIPPELGHVIHAGTLRDEKGVVRSNGGRVLAAVSCAATVTLARMQAMEVMSKIHFDALQFRRDIGKAIIDRKTRVHGATYKAAGVDIDAGDDIVARIGPSAKSTHRAGLRAGIGLFGCVFSPAEAGYHDDYSLVSGTDGVGTKLSLAQAAGRVEGLGFDLVAMCANDVLCHAAEPLFFLDYYACGRLQPDEAFKVIDSVARACKEAGCALAGGETAEMPGCYRGKDFDMAGFVVGAAPNAALLPRTEAVAHGDVVIGVASSGLHSNGFSLVRRVVRESGIDLADKCHFEPQRTWGEVLLEPTRIYVRALLPLLRSGKVKAAVHVTGGGIPGNLQRVLPPGCGARLDASCWRWPKVFHWLAAAGAVAEAEMLRSFNCGLGFLLIAAAEEAEAVRAAAAESFEAWRVGTVQAGGSEVVVEGAQLPMEVEEKAVRVAVLISGFGSNLQALLDRASHALCPFRVVLVVSNEPGAFGLQRAHRHGVETAVIPHRNFASRQDFEAALLRTLAAHSVQLVCLAGFMRILTPFFVQRCRGRLLNVHPSLLPAFKGHNAHRLVLQAGVRITGASVHFATEDVDCGAIIAQGSCPVLFGDDEASLSERVRTEVEHRIFPEAVEAVARGRCRLHAEENRAVWRSKDDEAEPLLPLKC